MPFACIAFRRDVLDTVGLLDDGFFMYFEDIDYCLRVREAGFRLLYWPRARIVHLVGKSSNVTAAEAEAKRAPRYYYEARTRFYAKHVGMAGLMLANAAWLAGRSVSRARQLVQRDHFAVRESEGRGLWTNALHPFRARRSARSHAQVSPSCERATPQWGFGSVSARRRTPGRARAFVASVARTPFMHASRHATCTSDARSVTVPSARSADT